MPIPALEKQALETAFRKHRDYPSNLRFEALHEVAVTHAVRELGLSDLQARRLEPIAAVRARVLSGGRDPRPMFLKREVRPLVDFLREHDSLLRIGEIEEEREAGPGANAGVHSGYSFTDEFLAHCSTVVEREMRKVLGDRHDRFVSALDRRLSHVDTLEKRHRDLIIEQVGRDVKAALSGHGQLDAEAVGAAYGAAGAEIARGLVIPEGKVKLVSDNTRAIGMRSFNGQAKEAGLAAASLAVAMGQHHTVDFLHLLERAEEEVLNPALREHHERSR